MMTEKGKWQSSLMRPYRGFADNYIDGILPGREKFCRKGILPGRQEVGRKEEEVSA
ncbi:MAG: hypothetical protein LIP12_06440 [Clostridiales bacterium]|nr:hypothetical protein [Clostridiales bacterium]